MTDTLLRCGVCLICQCHNLFCFRHNFVEPITKPLFSNIFDVFQLLQLDTTMTTCAPDQECDFITYMPVIPKILWCFACMAFPSAGTLSMLVCNVIKKFVTCTWWCWCTNVVKLKRWFNHNLETFAQLWRFQSGGLDFVQRKTWYLQLVYLNFIMVRNHMQFCWNNIVSKLQFCNNTNQRWIESTTHLHSRLHLILIATF